jgi:hypothetical protein
MKMVGCGGLLMISGSPRTNTIFGSSSGFLADAG